MTKEEKKEYLSRYTVLEGSICRRLEEVERLHALAERMQLTLYSGPRGRNGGDRLQQTVERISLLSEEVNGDVARLLDVRTAIIEAVAAVREPVRQLLLEYRYLDGCTWEQIAEKLSYSVMQVHRLHAKALEELALFDLEQDEK